MSRSRWKRSTCMRGPVSGSLSATSRLSWPSLRSASHTLLMPPTPISRISRYGPTIRAGVASRGVTSPARRPEPVSRAACRATISRSAGARFSTPANAEPCRKPAAFSAARCAKQSTNGFGDVGLTARRARRARSCTTAHPAAARDRRTARCPSTTARLASVACIAPPNAGEYPAVAELWILPTRPLAFRLARPDVSLHKAAPSNRALGACKAAGECVESRVLGSCR